MKNHSIAAGLTALAFSLVTNASFAQTTTYPDGHGSEVTFPQGSISFADKVVHYDTGSKDPIKVARDPSEALGVPDYDQEKDRNFVSLGCTGELMLQFTDNQLVDIPGPDLYVFEIGPDVEPTGLAISKNGKDWVRIGRISGGKAEVDIAPYVSSDDAFRFVRLVDLGQKCGGRWPGADIDAVGAIGSAQHIALSGEVLFDTGKYKLKPAATAAIDKALAEVVIEAVQAIEVAGHTDSVGNDQTNQTLSKNRAQSVAAYLTTETGLAADKLSIVGYGESHPVANNDTATGRSKNRRVEITLRSEQTKSNHDSLKTTILGLWKAGKYGILELHQQNGRITGNYDLDGGRIRGEFTSDTVIEGYWIENSSNQACDSEKDGSAHWGRLRMQFESADQHDVDTQWAYCDSDSWSGNWPHGERIL